jgi:hypothetical protein
MCRTEFVAVLLDGSEVDLPVVVAEAEFEGAVTCPNRDCEEVFLVPEFEILRRSPGW